MKRLYLLRHAKSSWSNSELDDFDRPLNKRGKSQLDYMYNYICENNLDIDKVYSSNALRAKITANSVLKDFNIELKNELYHASLYEISELIKNTNNTINSIAIVGHNPGLNNVASHYINYYDNIQTCSILAIDFNISDWKLIDKKFAKIVFYKNPPKK